MVKTTLEEYEQLVKEQGLALLDIIQSVALGDLDVKIEVPEGIEVLSDLALGIEIMIDDIREMLAEQEQAKAEVEQARQQLEVALQEVLAVQRRYLRQGWEDYASPAEADWGYFYSEGEEGPTAEAWLAPMTAAVQQGDAVIESDEPEGLTLAFPIAVHGEVIGAMGLSREGAKQWSTDEIATTEAIVEQIALALENQRLFEEAQQATFLTGERIKDLDCLNDIGRQMEGWPPVPEFLQWVTQRVPEVMRHAEVCVAAVEYEGQVYGVAEAVELPHQIAQALRVRGETVGRIAIAYTQAREFLNEESALLGDVARRVSGYIENQRLLQETQARVERERLVRTITDRVRRGADTEAIMRTTLQELSQLLGTDRLIVRLGTQAQLCPESLDPSVELGTGSAAG